MGQRKIASLLIILVFSLSFAQCERKDIYGTSGDKPFSVLTYDISSWFAYPSGIDILVGTRQYKPGSTYDFGTIWLGSSSPTVVFTIRNTGTENITMSGAPIVAVGGTNMADFLPTDPSLLTLAPGSSTFFSVRFIPGASGVRSGAITIQSDDPNRPVYSITLTGIGSPVPAPNLDIWIGVTNHLSGDLYDFGTVTELTSSTITVTIRNTGNAVLNILSYSMIGTCFTTDLGNPSINPGSSINFNITFMPASSTGYTGQLKINSNDPDESVYYIPLQGMGAILLLPDINLQFEGSDLNSGNGIGLASVALGNSSVLNFTIQNTGTGDLSLTGSPIVKVTGTDLTAFAVSGPGTSIIPAGYPDEPFTVTFTPYKLGNHAAKLVIASNDPDSTEQPYTIDLNGSGTGTPDIFVHVSGTEVPSGTEYYFGEQLIQEASPDVTFTIENKGTDTLTVSYPSISGTGSGDFSFTNPLMTMIDPDLNTTFTISAKPTYRGDRYATLEFSNSDPDSFENPYTITLRVRGAMPFMLVNGGGTPETSFYDPIANKFTPSYPVGGNVGPGGQSFQVPSGVLGDRVVIHGGGSQTFSWYDPVALKFTADASLIPGNIGPGALSFFISDSTYMGYMMIVQGGSSYATCMFNPMTNQFETHGIQLMGGNAGAGSLALPISDGNMLVICGNGTPYTTLFNQVANQFQSNPPISPTALAVDGAHAFGLDSGPYSGSMMVIPAGGNQTRIYDPYMASFADYSLYLNGNAGSGAHSIPISSGPYSGWVLIINGFYASSPNPAMTSLYDPNTNTIVPGPTFTDGPVGEGALSFPIMGGTFKGMYMIIHGYGLTVTTIFDPATLNFISLPTDDLTYPVGAGSLAFPARTVMLPM